MSFDFHPQIVGRLVEIRPLRENDFDGLFAVGSDPRIWEQHPNPDRYRKTEFGRFFRDSLESGEALTVLDRSDGRIIGSSRFHGYDAERDEVEIGWTFLARSHWGGSYNGELKRLMLRHAFKFVGTVILLVVPENKRSRRAVEKIGGIPAGSRADASGRKSRVYRIRAEEFSPVETSPTPDQTR